MIACAATVMSWPLILRMAGWVWPDRLRQISHLISSHPADTVFNLGFRQLLAACDGDGCGGRLVINVGSVGVLVGEIGIINFAAIALSSNQVLVLRDYLLVLALEVRNLLLLLDDLGVEVIKLRLAILEDLVDLLLVLVAGIGERLRQLSDLGRELVVVLAEQLEVLELGVDDVLIEGRVDGGHVVRVGWECAARSGLGVVHLELEVYRSPPQKS